MNVDTPLWVLLAASAFGGAVLTGLVTLGTRLLDLRHRHDETRRDHYVAALAALDACQQALTEAVQAFNEDQKSVPSDAETEDRKAGRDKVAAAIEDTRGAVIAARRAVLQVNLFAPKKVAELLIHVYGDMQTEYMKLRDAFGGEQLDQLENPQFPAVLWNDLRDAIRRDLGVRRLKLTI